MDFIILLFFLWIGYIFFRNFMSAGTGAKDAKPDLSNIKSYLEQAPEREFNDNGEWQSKADGPTARGRARLAQKSRINSPWRNAGVKAGQASRPKLNVRKARRDSHKNPVQRGRRGKNMDQNRHRHDDWGQRGDSGFLSGTRAVFFLVIMFAVLYALSQITPEMLDQIGL